MASSGKPTLSAVNVEVASPDSVAVAAASSRPTVSASKVEAAVSEAAAACSLPTAEVIGKQPTTTFYLGLYWCNICQTGMNSEDILNMHLVGRKHKSKMSRVDADMYLPHVPLGPLPGTDPSKKKKKSGGGNSTPANIFKCEICDVEFNNEIPYIAHMAGKRHAKKLKAPAINVTNSRFSCAVCQFVGNSPSHLDAHLKGKMHAKKAGLPAPPPGPAVTPPKPDSEKKPNRFHPYFKSYHRETGKRQSAPHHSNSSYTSCSSSSSYNSSSKPTERDRYPYSAVPRVSTSSSAVYSTGISGSNSFGGYQLFDK